MRSRVSTIVLQLLNSKKGTRGVLLYNGKLLDCLCQSDYLELMNYMGPMLRAFSDNRGGPGGIKR